MASKKTVTPDNLAALGVERLAAILVELADGDAEVKRRLRVELAAQAGGDSIAAEIGKRISALRSARSFVDWQKRRDFVRDLDLQRAMIADRVAPTRADLALDLMWRFLDLAEPVINRVDDSTGSVGDVFRSACEDLGAIAVRAKPDSAVLADRVFTALLANDYGVYDGLVPHTGAEIGRRLLAAGRAAEALDALEFARPKRPAVRATDHDDLYLAGFSGGAAWEEAYIEALDATGRQDQAQRLRWAAFEERLSSTHLRAYLKRLPDFEGVEAEDRAMQYALGFGSLSVALNFFREWPDQARAAQLVLARAPEIDGNLYFLLDPAAQLIEGKYPMAATLLRRAMVEDTLNGAKSTRYKHAARHLLECASLAPGNQDFVGFETHESFVDRLRAKHGRKTGFWGQVTEASGGGRR
jgi:hypothetical protein